MPYVQPSWNLPHPAFNPYAYLFSHSIYCFNIILNFGYISSLISRLVELTSLRFCIFININDSWFSIFIIVDDSWFRIRDKIIFCDGFWVDLRSYNGLFFIVWRLRWRVDFLIVVFLFIVFWWWYLFFSWWFWYFFGWGLLNFFNRWGRCGFFKLFLMDFFFNCIILFVTLICFLNSLFLFFSTKFRPSRFPSFRRLEKLCCLILFGLNFIFKWFCSILIIFSFISYCYFWILGLIFLHYFSTFCLFVLFLSF